MTSKISSTIRSRKVLVVLTAVVISSLIAICVCSLKNFAFYRVSYSSDVVRIGNIDSDCVNEPVAAYKLKDDNRPEKETKNREEFIQPLKKIINDEEKEITPFSETDKFDIELRQNINFRRNDMKFWDLDPEYEFQAFGHNFHLVLSQDESTERNILVTIVSKNTSTHEQFETSPHCYYSGYVKDEPNSQVTVNLCNGMKGYIRAGEKGTYYIEPASDRNNTLDHILRKIDFQHESISSDGKYCATVGENHIHSQLSAKFSKFENETIVNKKRRKRNTDEYTLELLIVVSRNFAEFHGSDVYDYILLLMKEVQKLFKDNSIGQRINVVPIEIVELKDDEFLKSKNLNNRVMLESFCEWQHEYNYSPKNTYHHDGAVFITRDDICSLSNTLDQCKSILGLAYIGEVCQKKGCAIVKDTGMSTAFTIAHELGHMLNMKHDVEPCNNNYEPKIMAGNTTRSTDFWTWSACSRQLFADFLEQENVECLLNLPTKRVGKSSPTELPGLKYTLDKQCEMHYRKGAVHCSLASEPCSVLFCVVPKVSECTAAGFPWAEYTPCGPNHWCRRRECVVRKPIENVIHGGWGEWQPYSSCSRTCGSGVRFSFRPCNNPKNENGGEYCKGKNLRYQSCNTEECPPGTPDFRAQQCAKFNNSTVQWEPANRSNLPLNRCMLYCRGTNDIGSYALQEKVIDGTRCDNDTSFGVCVNGRCRETGCDHILDSQLRVDNCGVCGGNNSTCKLVRKVFHRNATVGYKQLDTIPAGATKIEIKQIDSAQGSHLNLRNAETDKYILNGLHSVSIYPKEIIVEGFKMYYGGSVQNPESIVSRSLSRLPKDLILEIYSSSTAAPTFNVTCQYMIQMASSDDTMWIVTNEWSKCNKICYGQQEKLIRCVRKKTGNVVYFESCARLPKPQPETRICNEHCTLGWKVIDQTECSSNCGPGIRKLTHRCYTEYLDGIYGKQNVSNQQYLPDIQCSHISKPSDTESCKGSCDKVHWKYSKWEPCSTTCGHGTQKRQAMCVDELDQPVDESACSAVQKKTENGCLMGECPDWRFGDWSECSVSCGLGEQKRRIWCVENNRVISPTFCLPHKKPPPVKKSCKMSPCPEWITGEWSKCSVSCGIGTEYRTVRCNLPDENLCPSSLKPSETRHCFLYSCPHPSEYQWRTGTWSECSSSCGKGMKRREVKCYNHKRAVVDDVYCSMSEVPAAVESCQERNCPQWIKSAWSSCSVTCGHGISIRSVRCEVDEKQVSDTECQELKPKTTKLCEMIPCLTTTTLASKISVGIWRSGPWGECSVSCGGGIKIRNVVCSDERGNQVSYCSDKLRPASSSPCNTYPCADQVQWKYGEWSQCNQTCGGGYQRRLVQCVSNIGENVEEIYCNRDEKPAVARECQNAQCPKIIYLWKSTRWSDCSVTCGNGVSSRTVQCYKLDENNVEPTEIVADSYCQDEKPSAEEECRKDPCYSYRWRIGLWSECSASCGSGMQKRWIDCERINVQNPNKTDIVDVTLCDKATRPPHHQECENICREEYTWVTGPWGDCYGPCGQKKKKRKLYCYNNGKHVHRSYCKHLVRPKRRRNCIQQKCDPVSCADIKHIHKAGNDKEYVINILGRNISIYCHEMWSSQPKEYLSLAVGTSENYSEYYSKKLTDPDVTPCPSRRTQILSGVEEDYSFSGKTVFQKLRLNVTSLQVIMNDYTFARTQGLRAVPVGEAGDCYSKQNCPQGSFSINVSGTGLRIAQSVQWEKVGNKVAMDIKFYRDRRKVVGRCGGYCGLCRPTNGLKLDVLPP